MGRIIQLSDVPDCPLIVSALDDKYRSKIALVKNIRERDRLLDEMRRDFAVAMEREPGSRDLLVETYQFLMRRYMRRGD